MQAPSQHSHSAPAGCQQLNGWILWINLTLALANFCSHRAGSAQAGTDSTAASSKALGKEKNKKQTPHQRIILQLNPWEHHFCCSKDIITFAAAYAYTANLLKKFQEWKSHRLWGEKKVLRTRHAIVRSREKETNCKSQDYINDLDGQKYQAEEVSRTDRIWNKSPLRTCAGSLVCAQRRTSFLPNLTLHSVLLLQNMNHQVFSAIQSRDLWAEMKFRVLGFVSLGCPFSSAQLLVCCSTLRSQAYKLPSHRG